MNILKKLKKQSAFIIFRLLRNNRFVLAAFVKTSPLLLAGLGALLVWGKIDMNKTSVFAYYIRVALPVLWAIYFAVDWYINYQNYKQKITKPKT